MWLVDLLSVLLFGPRASHVGHIFFFVDVECSHPELFGVM
jgi:hypothetical protein